MTQIQDSPLMYGREANAHSVDVGSETVLMSESPIIAREEQYNSLKDDCLIEWMKDPSQLQEEEGFEPPTREVIRRGYLRLEVWRQKGLKPPLRVVADGRGGIVFELELGGDCSATFRIGPDLEWESVLFKDCEVVERRPD